MREIIIIQIICISLFGLLACKKTTTYPTSQLPANVPTLIDFDGVGRWGKFVITDAVMYVQNNETGIKTVYNHFSPTKSRSSLRYGGSQFSIEDIIKDTTTYSFWKPINFPGVGKFVLNDDTTRYYGVNYIGPYSTIIEDPTHTQQNLGGSGRPYSGQTISKADKTIAIQIEEIEGSINGYNCKYWTQLTLKKIQEW